jgi:Kef-type K+ transport system membrane component KefB
MPNISQYLPIADPTWIFFIVLCIILLAPIIMGRLRIPHLVGMILAGVLIGPNGFNILAHDSSFELFGNVGLYYIMFLAGLEMNMSNLRTNKTKAVTHGLLAFVIPISLGFLVNIYILHYSAITSLLLASMYASYTLLSYPIVIRYGLAHQRSVTIAVGATAVTDTLTLLVLALVSGMFKGEVNLLFWIQLLLKMSAVFLIIILIFPRITRRFFKRNKDNTIQLIFVLALAFLGAGMMEAIGLQGILGAFFTGLVLNRYIPRVSPLMNHLEFMGNSLFIPYFLIGVGMLVNPAVIFRGWGTIKVALVMIMMALTCKWIASCSTQKIFGLKGVERQLIYGLSSAQAGATLAAVLVGHSIVLANGQRLLNDDVLNGTIILILVTCIFSSMVTEHAAKQMVLKEQDMPEDKRGDEEHILIALGNPDTMETLVNLGLLVHNPKIKQGMYGLNIVGDDKNSGHNLNAGRKLLERATRIATAANVRLVTQSRVSSNIADGIIHTFKEAAASEVVMGLHRPDGKTNEYLGKLAGTLPAQMLHQIMMMRCAQPINTLRRIIVAAPSKAQYVSGFYRWVERTSRLADNVGCRVEFHSHPDTLNRISEYVQSRHHGLRATYINMTSGDQFSLLAASINADDLFVVVTARPDTISYNPFIDSLPEQLENYFNGKNLMIIYPDQYKDNPNVLSFTLPPQLKEKNAYKGLKRWMKKKMES